jgi:hypothetical protein
LADIAENSIDWPDHVVGPKQTASPAPNPAARQPIPEASSAASNHAKAGAAISH